MSQAGAFARKIGLHRDRQAVTLKLDPATDPAFDKTALQTAFLVATGWQLNFE